VALFVGLAGYGLLTYGPVNLLANPTVPSSQSARGTQILLAHFPPGETNATYLLLRYSTPVWNHPVVLSQATQRLAGDPVFHSVSGPLDPNGSQLSARQLQLLHGRLGPATALPLTPPGGTSVPLALYNAYRATAQFISPDGRTVQFGVTLKAGAPDSTGATQAIPHIRAAVARAGSATGAIETGVTGLAAFSYDTGTVSDNDLMRIVPVVLIVLALLLALVLRSLVAPLYLIASVGLSYLAALGLAVLIFMGIGHGNGVILYLPFLMFVFLMALGSDYNILVMSRIREEAQQGSLPEAVTRAIGTTGGTVTSAGIILAAAFYAFTLGGGASGQEIGTGIAVGILLDTFLVRTLFIPSTVVLLQRWNWWPSRLAVEPIEERASA
jgi:RND superfamily putative drug exporter